MIHPLRNMFLTVVLVGAAVNQFACGRLIATEERGLNESGQTMTGQPPQAASTKGEWNMAVTKTLTLSSPVFEHEGPIPSKYTCDGRDVSPPLRISGVPDDTESMVLIVDDPDAPMGTWTHWLLWNIPPDLQHIQEDTVPQEATEGMNSFNRRTYGGPCPPSGNHRYFFKLYALDSKLDLNPGANKQALELAMQNHILMWTELMGRYGRPTR